MFCISENKLKQLSAQVGLKLVGLTSLAPLKEDKARLEQWQNAGHMGELKYMARDTSLLTDPGQLFGREGTLLSFVVYYARTPRPALPLGFGRVARYAWGLDYHQVIAAKLARLAEALSAYFDDNAEFVAKPACDAFPILERALAKRAGHGFIGKNTLLITPGQGSFSFMAELYLNAQVERTSSTIEIGKRCGACTLCLDKCPTQALVSDFVLDARRCISYLTIEKRGMLSEWERRAMGEWVFGCDICQEVCPYNKRALLEGKRADFSELDSSSGVGPHLDLEQILLIRDDQQFRERFRKTALTRTKRSGLLRNCAVVAANTGASELTRLLSECAQVDPCPVVRAHALWAATQLLRRDSDCKSKISQLLNCAARDPCSEVQGEVQRVFQLP